MLGDKTKIYDTFLFFNELDLLEIRLNVLHDVVDHFVIVECTKTYQGNDKPLYFDNNKERYSCFLDQIIHIIVDDCPVNSDPWELEGFQRNAIARGLINCNLNDQIIVSDLDEIVNPEIVKNASNIGGYKALIQPLYYYYVNNSCIEMQNLPWSIMSSFKNFDGGQNMRNRIIRKHSDILSNTYENDEVTLISDGGWHFSCLGGAEQIIKKIESFSHHEYNTPRFKNKNNIERKIMDGQDVFGRDLHFEIKMLDESFPRYLIENQDKYSDIITNRHKPMIFDQYSRYNALKELLNLLGFNRNKTLLDIGSGPECLLSSVVDINDIYYLDPLITKENDDHYIKGNIFTDKLVGKIFNCTTAIDVLEHIPVAMRASFIEKMCDLSGEFMVIAFPSSENYNAMDVDNHINEQYRNVCGKDYPWLEEHFEYGLPSLKDTVNQIESLGWNCQTIGHGYAPWLKEMLSFTLYAWDIHENHNIILEMSEKFNIGLSDYDLNSHEYYRNYIVASKNDIPSLDFLIKEITPSVQKQFEQILAESKEKIHDNNFILIQEKNALIQELNCGMVVAGEDSNRIIEGLHDELVMAGEDSNRIIEGLHDELVMSGEDSNRIIEGLNTTIGHISVSFENNVFQHSYVSKWADGLKRRQDKIDSNFLFRNLERYFINKESLWTIPKKVIKIILPISLIDKYRLYKQRVKFSEVVQSVDVHKKIIIAFPIITWSFRFQRPQHLLKELSKQGYTIIYLSLGVNPKGEFFSSLEDTLSNVSFTKLDDDIYKLWLHSYDDINIYTDYMSDKNLNNISLTVQAALKTLKPNYITYMVQFPGWNRLVFDLKSKFMGDVVFDCMDDHSGFTTNHSDALKEEHALIEKADLIISSSQLLYDKNVKLNSNTIQVKNGTEYEHFCNPIKNNKLDYLSDQPIIGYYGAISDWFDMSIVEYCAVKMPGYNFVMIGATTGCDTSRASKIDNIHFMGEIPYKKLPGYFAYFDVCLIPFKIIPLTLATNPVKFYEYISAGKPVVSVELPELIPYSDYCYLAKDKEGFCNNIQDALDETSNALVQDRMLLAKENSWSNRAQSIYDKLGSN